MRILFVTSLYGPTLMLSLGLKNNSMLNWSVSFEYCLIFLMMSKGGNWTLRFNTKLLLLALSCLMCCTSEGNWPESRPNQVKLDVVQFRGNFLHVFKSYLAYIAYVYFDLNWQSCLLVIIKKGKFVRTLLFESSSSLYGFWWWLQQTQRDY